VLKEIKDFLEKYMNIVGSIINPIPNSNFKSMPQQNSSLVLKWSNKNKGTGIEVTNGGANVWLKESAYMFRTVISE